MHIVLLEEKNLFVYKEIAAKLPGNLWVTFWLVCTFESVIEQLLLLLIIFQIEE